MNATKFALALAYVNCGEVVDESDLDLYGFCSPEKAVLTQETVEQYQQSMNAKGGVHKTPFGDVIYWTGVQANGKGTPRGTMYLMDFGTERYAYFYC